MNKKRKKCKRSAFHKIKLFLSPKLRGNDLKLFEMSEKIWKETLGQTSDDWQELCLLVNTPGKIRRENMEVFSNFSNYLHIFLSKCLKIIKKFPKDTIERMLAFKMVQEYIYSIYHDKVKGYSLWKYSREGIVYKFTIGIPNDKMGIFIGKRGSNIQQLQSEHSNIKVRLFSCSRTLNLSSESLDDVLCCAQKVNNVIDNSGILIRSIRDREKWMSGILFELSMKYREVSPINNDLFWLTHLTGIGDLITENDEVYELKLNERNAISKLSTGKYTGVGFLKDKSHAFCLLNEKKIKISKPFLTEKQQQQIILKAIEMLNETQDREKTNDNFSNNYFQLFSIFY